MVARAGVSGNAWTSVWLPAVIAGRDHGPAPGVPDHLRRRAAGPGGGGAPTTEPPFTEQEDLVLTELSRQVGLALHNVRPGLGPPVDPRRGPAPGRRAAGLPDPDRGGGRCRAAPGRAGPPRRGPAAPGGPGRQRPPGQGPGDRGPRGRGGRGAGRDRRSRSRPPCRSCAIWPTASTRRCSWTTDCPRPSGPWPRGARWTWPRGRRHRAVLAGHRGGGVLLLPRGPAERGQARPRLPRGGAGVGGGRGIALHRHRRRARDSMPGWPKPATAS